MSMDISSLSKKPEINRKSVFFIILILIIGSLIPVFTINQPYTYNETYETQELHTIDTIFKFVEKYKVPMDYKVVSSKKRIKGIIDLYTVLETIIRNTDTKEGTFIVKHTLVDKEGIIATEYIENKIPSGQTASFYTTVDTRAGQDTKGTYYVVVPKKIVDIGTTKIIPETKVITQERTVTAYRTRKVSLLKLLFI